MQSKKPFRTVVFVDIPDPDNILMILHALALSKERVAIVLSPRILDLSAKRYDQKFSEIRKVLGFKVMFEPIAQGKEPNVCRKWKEFFQADGTLSDREVLKDTLLYMRVSKVRIKECIEEQYPEGKDYEIFWDPGSLSKIKKPDMRHAIHTADYAFNFNENEQQEYQNIANLHKASDRRNRLRDLCQQYIFRQTKGIHLNSSKIGPTDMKDLFEANLEVEDAILLIGGPLTEALQYIHRTNSQPKTVYAMLGTLTNDRNILGRPQFNIGKDAKSANAFLNEILKKKIEMLIVPTECCKGKDEQNPCPYVLQHNEYQDLLKRSPLLSKMVASWVKETGQETGYHAFDWIAAAVMGRRKIFQWVPVKHKKHKKHLPGEIIIDIEFSKADQPSTIWMATENYTILEMLHKRLNLNGHDGFEEDTLRTGGGAVNIGQSFNLDVLLEAWRREGYYEHLLRRYVWYKMIKQTTSRQREVNLFVNQLLDKPWEKRRWNQIANRTDELDLRIYYLR
ncbi:hypothetical protein COCC4DRAFT_42188 [Bipolaris maydis ATCC 48331]|uniref:Inosine/uridine-preferring nucleoside hydrolase domain-containing protein n=2 Tax=Cochliobolus heterostrophus TaxID=5016 RepID=M2UFN7_COCH5|nr:uncharacterized protein COCC4DRAFT_42188 [Bipolaris maydis ATCC 48331]EMD86737.1 hypothetical protein COCHEDRAFT_1218279 [Bipolaris maydis C5]KAJ5047746.1 hypothetical protein J3E74DRAFT_412553 [Bipolaris maydis]ENI03128.1 hypothetical protein COCC4DRAFT_42188 [Bipolaris maydis ATCC 48331]KAJ5052539.1 hypothetical protein J3E74DRAFT_412061 [Bipolaris maydis]KAJ6192221.1 hypothetical protein J3E72DRAFT_380004 [Bipolaris maydis]